MVLGTQRTDIYDLLQYLKGSSRSLVFSQVPLKKKKKNLFILYWGIVKVKWRQSCPTLFDPMDYSLPCPPSIGFSRQEYWSGLPFPSPGDPPDPGIEPALLRCRQMLYRLSHQGSLNQQCCDSFMWIVQGLSHTYTWIPFPQTPFSRPGCHITLSRIPCAIQ